MIYRCNYCSRVIAEIKRLNCMNLKGRDITIEGNDLKIICKCKKENRIDLKPYQED